MQTFLFTDVEGSTRLWEEHPDGMGAALQRHDRILTEAVEAAGGTVVKTMGDGMVAVFGSASDSLSATLAAQQELCAEEWGPVERLKVRMGIHSGEADERDHDYFGPVLNRTSRIMAAGHGGQVLISEVTALEVADRLPPGASLLDLGIHRLKDLTLPEHLFQLAHDEIDTEFAPLHTLEATANNLPFQTTEFLGRTNELTAIQTMLDSPGTRLLTIVGPGGAGKTRLGLQVAAETIDRYRDGVYFVDLAPERDPDAAFEAVVRALDLPAVTGESPLQALITGLRDREMLLLLDNFEQITEAATGVVELLQKCPHLTVLVTSRETLRVRPEHVYPVPPLSLPHPRADVADIAESEAVQLFVERAQAVDPGFSLTDANAGVVARICLRLDGLPLAIELAAARLRVFTPADLLDRLEDRLDVLGTGGRDLPDRQRTLWAAIGWSYELLEEEEKTVFELMSVFSPTRLEAIEAVARSAIGQVDLLEALASLVDKSLVRSESGRGSQRFSMLLMISEYAAERLGEDPGREETFHRSHAVYFCDRTGILHRSLRGSGRQDALDDLADEIGNLRSAWRYWVDRGDLEHIFLQLDGLWALHDAKGWYHAAIELARDALRVLASADPSPDHAAEELTLRTSLARALMAVRGYDAEVEEAFRDVLRLSKLAGAHQFPVLRALATYYMNIADWASAKEVGEELLAMAEGLDDESFVIDGNFVTGAAMAFSGDMEEGMRRLDRVIELFDPADYVAHRFRLGPHTGVSARVASGLLMWQGGEVIEGIRRVAEALDVAEELQHPYSQAYAIYHNAFLELLRKRLPECRERARQLAEISDENDYQVWRTLATVLQGVASTFQGQTEEGLVMTEKGIELYRGLTTPPVFWPLILMLRSLVHAAAGDPGRGLELIDEAIELASATGGITPDFMTARGDVLRQLPPPGPDDAEAAYRRAIDEARSSGMRLIELQALNRMVALRREQGREPDHSDELRAVFEIFSDGIEESDLAEARELLGLDTAVEGRLPG